MNLSKGGFTLIELLVAVAIISVGAIYVLAVFNPVEVLKKGRDNQRLEDIMEMKRAIEVYISSNKNPNLGPQNTIYATAAVESATTGSADKNVGNIHLMERTDGYGWLPINFSSLSKGSPLPHLRFDPSGDYSVNSRYYYRYFTDGSYWELNAKLESSSNSEKMKNDSGNSEVWYEVGSKLTLLGD